MSEEQVIGALNGGEFSGEVTSSAEISVVVMTQDWCPQWIALKSWIYDIAADADVNVYEIVYNTEDYSDKFMKFKEDVWKNSQIPYLRFYSSGKLFKETNYVGRREFAAILASTPK